MQEHDARKVDYPDDQYLVTSLPQSSSEAIKRDGETECMCTGWFKRMVLSTPGFPSPIVHPPKVIYEVREVVGRGLGVFASEDIEAGGLIIAERPLLVQMAWNHARYRSDLSQEERLRAVSDRLSRIYTVTHEWLQTYTNMEENMELICSRMSPQALKAYTSLYNSHQTDGSGPLTGIMRTNGFGIGTDDPAVVVGEGREADYSCVGAIASRFNHRCVLCERALVHHLNSLSSCSPNAVYKFNMPSFSMQIHTVRPIAKGEEITVAYIALEIPATERQLALQPYGFISTLR